MDLSVEVFAGTTPTLRSTTIILLCISSTLAIDVDPPRISFETD
jgi:hypothetical protein